MGNPYEACRDWCAERLPRRQIRPKVYAAIVKVITARKSGVAISLNDHDGILPQLEADVRRQLFGFRSMFAGLFAPLVIELISILLPLVLAWLKDQLLLTTAGDVVRLNDAMKFEAAKYA